MTDDASTAAALLELGAATLGESGGRPMRNRIRAAWPGAALAAPAYPVRCTPGDNLAIHVGGRARARRCTRWSSSVGDDARARVLGRGAHDRGRGPRPRRPRDRRLRARRRGARGARLPRVLDRASRSRARPRSSPARSAVAGVGRRRRGRRRATGSSATSTASPWCRVRRSTPCSPPGALAPRRRTGSSPRCAAVRRPSSCSASTRRRYPSICCRSRVTSPAQSHRGGRCT